MFLEAHVPLTVNLSPMIRDKVIATILSPALVKIAAQFASLSVSYSVFAVTR